MRNRPSQGEKWKHSGIFCSACGAEQDQEGQTAHINNCEFLKDTLSSEVQMTNEKDGEEAEFQAWWDKHSYLSRNTAQVLYACVVDSVKTARAEDHTRRWNFEKADEGIRVCFGEHDRSSDCEYVEYVPKSSVAAAVNAERERCIGKLANSGLIMKCKPITHDVAAAILSDDQEARNG